MSKRAIQRDIRRARREVVQIGATLDNALVFAGENAGQDTAIRLLRTAHDQLAVMSELLAEALSTSRVHSIPMKVLSVLYDCGLDPDDPVTRLVRVLLTRGQNGHPVASTAHVLGMTQSRLAKTLHRKNLRSPREIGTVGGFLTAVALLIDGEDSEVVAHTVGYSTSLSLSAFLERHGGIRIRDARHVQDFPRLLVQEASGLTGKAA